MQIQCSHKIHLNTLRSYQNLYAIAKIKGRLWLDCNVILYKYWLHEGVTWEIITSRKPLSTLASPRSSLIFSGDITHVTCTLSCSQYLYYITPESWNHVITRDGTWQGVILLVDGWYSKKHRLCRIYARTVHYRFWPESYERLNIRVGYSNTNIHLIWIVLYWMSIKYVVVYITLVTKQSRSSEYFCLY